ncbi:MAG: sortase [Patescibacteria group bacterium]
MRPSGTIYSYHWAEPSGEVNIAVSVPTLLWYRFLRLVGSGLITLAVGGIIFLFGPMVREELTYRLHQREPNSAMSVLVDQARAQEEYRTFVENKARELGAIDTSFSVIIPKINARAKVVANVSAADERSYMSALKVGIAHAAGTVFPGMKGTIFLFAHSTDAPVNITRYNAVFYLLRELEAGDDVFVFFSDTFHPYRVVEKRVVDAADTSWIRDAQSGPEQLILQTCWPPGTTLKRLLVIAEPVGR